MVRKLLRNGFCLSILLHLLFILCFTLIIFQTPEKKKSPHLYVPAYVYSAPTIQRRASAQATRQKQGSKSTTANQSTALKTETKISQPKNIVVKPHQAHSSMLAASLQMLQEEQFKSINTSLKSVKPIYLVGDENAHADPFIKLIGEALSANFSYPKMAGELGIRGVVLVKLSIHPEGYFSDVQIVKSSDSQELDSAALYAVNKAPIIQNLDRFISAPETFVVGFIFK